MVDDPRASTAPPNSRKVVLLAVSAGIVFPALVTLGWLNSPDFRALLVIGGSVFSLCNLAITNAGWFALVLGIAALRDESVESAWSRKSLRWGVLLFAFVEGLAFLPILQLLPNRTVPLI